jgi:hypothetical protein
MQHAKDMGFNVTQSVSDGKYIHTYKNGAQMTIPLQEYMTSLIGNDPQAMDVYTTQAYVNRKQAVQAGVAQYGSEDAAENAYLNDVLSKSAKLASAGDARIDDHIKVLNAKQAILTDKVKAGSTDELALINEVYGITDQLEKANGAKAVYKSTGDYTDQQSLLGADKKSLRWRADHAAAASLMNADMEKASRDYSALNYEHTMTPDAYGLAAYNHAFEDQELHEKFKLEGLLEMEKAQLKNKIALEKDDASGKGPAENNIPTVNPYAPGEVSADQTHPSYEGYRKAFGEINDATRTAIVDYNRTVFDTYKADLNSTDPNVVSAAKWALDKTFGNPGAAGSMIDKNYNLKGELSNDPNFRATYQKAKGYVEQNKLVHDELYKTLKQKEPQINELTSMWGMTQRADEKNNVNLRDYFVNIMPTTDNYTASDKKDIAKLFSDDGKKVVDEKTFVKAFMKNHTPEEFAPSTTTKALSGLSPTQLAQASYIKMVQTAVEKFDDYSKLYHTTYNTDRPDGVPQGKILVKPYDASAYLGGAGGGAAAQSYTYPVDGAFWKDKGATGLVSLYKNITSIPANEVGVSGDGTNKMDFDVNSPARKIAMTFLEDITHNHYKGTDQKRPTGRVTYEGVAGGSPDLTSYKIDIDNSWVEANRGTPKKHGLTYGLTSNSIKIIIPKTLANNDFKKAVETPAIDLWLEHEPKVIESPLSGKLTFTKDKDGVHVSGVLKSLNNNGQWVTNSVAATGNSGQQIFDIWQQQLQINEAANKQKQQQLDAYYKSIKQ